jgi:hypothetical protein
MSFINNGQKIRCDGDDCRAERSAPIALHTWLSREITGTPAQNAGWLFVMEKNTCHHYCQRRITKYLPVVPIVGDLEPE